MTIPEGYKIGSFLLSRWNRFALSVVVFGCLVLVLMLLSQKGSVSNPWSLVCHSTGLEPKVGDAEHAERPLVIQIENGVIQRPLRGDTSQDILEGALSCPTSKIVRVLLWVRGDRPEFYFAPDRFGLTPDLNSRVCRKSCVRYVATQDHSLLSKVDMVLFNFDFFDGVKPTTIPPRPRPDIVYVYTSIENSNLKGRPSDPSLLNFFWSYHRNLVLRTSWLTAVNLTYPDILRPPLVPFEERESVLLASLVTRCNDIIGRGKFLGQLMKHIPTHNYGKYYRNRGRDGDYPEPEDRNGRPRLSYYKFLLTIENSLCTDHVSEKFARALNLSTIPVVASQNNMPPYGKMSPTENFHVNILDFKSVADVAAKLKEIGQSRELFNSYMSYRSKRPVELRPGFRSLMEEGGDNAALCQIANDMKTAEGRTKLAQHKFAFNDIESCLQGDIIGKHFKI